MSTTGERLDVIESGGRITPPHPGRTTAVVLVLALLAGSAWWVDQRGRRQTFEALLSCARTGQSAIVDARSRVTAMSAYVRPAFRAGPEPEARAGLYGIVEQAAGEYLPRVRSARGECAGVRPRRWQGELVQARAVYLDYIDAQLALLEATQADGSQIYTSRPELRDLREQAQRALAAAAPDGEAARAATEALDWRR